MLARLVSNGGVAGAGCGRGRAHPFETSNPPPPRLSRKGALRAGGSINAPLRDNRWGLSRKGVLSSFLYQPFYTIVLFFLAFTLLVLCFYLV